MPDFIGEEAVRRYEASQKLDEQYKNAIKEPEIIKQEKKLEKYFEGSENEEKARKEFKEIVEANIW